MKNIVIILLVLVLPVCAYLFFGKNNNDYVAVASDNNPSLLIYTSTMCLDCKKMKEVIKEVEKSYADKINFVSINALDNDRKIQNSIKKYNVQVVPTLVFTDISGAEKYKVEGYIPKEELESKIREVINE